MAYIGLKRKKKFKKGRNLAPRIITIDEHQVLKDFQFMRDSADV